jgi:hypothetical protein
MSSSSEAEFAEEEEEDDKDDGSYKDNDGGGGGDDEDDDEEEEEEETPQEDRKRASRKSVVSYAEDDDDDDDEEEGNDDDDSSDDDMPLAQLAAKMKKKTAPAAAANGKKTGATKKAAASPAKKKKTTTAASSSSASKSKATNGNSNSGGGSSNKTYEWASAALYGSNCDKGRLIQEMLCRWWYAYTWPDPKTLPKRPPENYDCLDGFPGVYVCTAGDEVGKILDKRDASQAPSFTNMANKDASELQELLLKALERQKEELIQHEGTGTSTEKDIADLIKWTKRVNPDKADREAKKVLQASKIKL